MNRMRPQAVRKVLIGLCLTILALVLAGCQAVLGGNRLTQREAYGIMDTDVNIKAYGRKAPGAIDRAIDEMKRLDSLLSSFNPESDVALVNAQAGVRPVKVSSETYQVIERALYFAEISAGSFDPTIFPVTQLWGIGGPQARVPSPDEIRGALALVDYRKVRLDPTEGSVFLTEKGMALDLGAIAKGYAVDQMAAVIRSLGVTSFLINAGGNVYAGGAKPDKSPWRVAVTDPRNPAEFMGVMSAHDLAIVSSGDYERYFEEGGVRYHHILDPKTGYPSRTSKGTTVFLPSSTDADGLSTALFILGPEKSEDILSKFPEVGVAFVLPSGDIVTKGIVDNFEFK